MPHHRHSVTAKNEALNITEVERVLRPRSLVLASPEQTAKESAAFFCLWRVSLVARDHCISPIAVKPRLIVTCDRRSAHGCPEPTGLDMPGRTRLERGSLPPHSR